MKKTVQETPDSVASRTSGETARTYNSSLVIWPEKESSAGQKADPLSLQKHPNPRAGAKKTRK